MISFLSVCKHCDLFYNQIRVLPNPGHGTILITIRIIENNVSYVADVNRELNVKDSSFESSELCFFCSDTSRKVLIDLCIFKIR